MIDMDRTSSYIESLDTGNGKFLDELERFSIETDVPIIRKQMQSFLKVMMKMQRPTRILEVGTAIGFSAILMADNTPAETEITTIEKYEKRIPLAKENFLKSGYDEKITLLEGDATDILKELADSSEKYDFIFMDAAKGQYINFLPDVKKLLSENGVLVTDNVLQDNTVIQSKFTVERRDRTIHKRMRDYLYTLTHDNDLTTTILPVADGIAVSVNDK